MNDSWCRRLAIIAVVWLVIAITLEIVITLAFR